MSSIIVSWSDSLYNLVNKWNHAETEARHNVLGSLALFYARLKTAGVKEDKAKGSRLLR